ncbi:hypothetical protein BGW38_005697 [Lunasporangiospora selenospora]|uniref:Snf7-domain-containing protein n=1 Tax=Lunasporangiospora selenospora TaxID=979761 RepID=A0A9P6FMQ7_9FUNG|nr:hypothetical protein BGW38_005697 [Lunasporangiospora selenospora]
MSTSSRKYNGEFMMNPSSDGPSSALLTTLPSPPHPDLSTFSVSSQKKRRLSLQTYLASFPEWSNPSRLDSLYSEFDKLKETNEFGYEANINWWRAVILGAARNGFLSSYQPHPQQVRYSTINSIHHIGGRSPEQAGGTPEDGQFEPTGSSVGVLELDLDYLGIKFMRNGCRPHSLPAVMIEMKALGEVVPRSEFLPWAGISWTGWIFHKVVKAPILWSLKQLSLSDSPSPPPPPSLTGPHSSSSMSSGGIMAGANTGGSHGLGIGLPAYSSSYASNRDTYVVLSMVQEAASRILKMQQESIHYYASDNLMTFADFREKFSRTALQPLCRKSPGGLSTLAGPIIALTDRDLEILIRYMQYEMKVLVAEGLDIDKSRGGVDDHEMIIKFATKDAIRTRSIQEITSTDKGIVELKETCRRLEKQISEIESWISETNEKIKAFLRMSQRSQAAFALRRRKNLEEVMKKRLGSLDTISSILFKIQSSETDAGILQAYQLGARTLAGVMDTRDENGEKVLSPEKVGSTMDRLSEVLADQQEIDMALNEGTEILVGHTVPGGVDEDELMAELDALMEVESTQEPTKPSHPAKRPSRESEMQTAQPSKRLTPPLPSEARVSAPPKTIGVRDQNSTSPGKRVAEIPGKSAMKQRRLSEMSIPSQDATVDVPPTSEIASSSYVVPVTSSPTPSRAEPQTENSAFKATEVGTREQEMSSQTMEQNPTFTEEDQKHLDEMLSELEGIEAPESELPLPTQDIATGEPQTAQDSHKESKRVPGKALLNAV